MSGGGLTRLRRLSHVTTSICLAGLLAGCAAWPTSELLGPPPGPQQPAGLPTTVRAVDETRAKMSKAIFGTEDLDGARIGKPNVSPVVLVDLPPEVSALATTRQSVILPARFGMSSIATLLTPREPKACSFIWHDGHSNTALERGGADMVVTALKAGCVVALMRMPGFWPNSGAANTPSGLTVTIRDPSPDVLHNRLFELDTPNRPAIDLFVGPIVELVDYLAAIYPSNSITMAGLSGGGLMTTLSAAIDTRITRSLSVAGSRENRDLQACGYDYEQCHPALYSKVSLEQMYVLAAQGADRIHEQILNQYDTCCYQGSSHTEYATAVESAVASTGSGQYVLQVDDTLQVHAVPNSAVTQLARWLTQPPPAS